MSGDAILNNFKRKMAELFSNSGDSDHTPHCVASNPSLCKAPDLNAKFLHGPLFFYFSQKYSIKFSCAPWKQCEDGVKVNNL